MGRVVRYRFEHRKCPLGSIAKCPGHGLVLIDAVNGFGRDIRYSLYSEDGSYAEVVATVDVRSLVEIPLPDPRLSKHI